MTGRMSSMYPSIEQIQRWRKKYRPGTRIVLVYMDSVDSPPVGTKGTVVKVDSIGTLRVLWDNGSEEGIVLGEDRFEVI